MFHAKKILLAVGGGIAVYRVAELARLLIKQGASVRCVMTRSACEFVTPLSFEALTGEQVYRDVFDLTLEREMGHIQLARWADVVLVAPATANLLAKLAHGIADDLLTTMMQVCNRPVLLAPAMNTSMWESPATQRNVRTLQDDGMHLIQPACGELACGEQGAGRLADLQDIVDALLPLLLPQHLKGQTWVVNAGPTVESWDAVRTLSNRASGTLGRTIASCAAALGAKVTLVAGPGTAASGPAILRKDVQSGDEMLQACEQAAKHADVFIATAAVSDFRFAEVVAEKIKRGNSTSMHVELVANPDIVAHIATMQGRPNKVIAFAAETSNHVNFAKQKLLKKGVDAIVANDVANMAKTTASGWWVSKGCEEALEKTSKMQFAQKIINKVMELEL
ncbi:MAG: bifunctional phosphopantothenoylcysteine decarboxylase/phosphopantothenate--cysteine ligase CoaBC [Mariprofundaceae bacterium]